ncbi:MAG: DnaA regulatory inactivator Hda [Methylococcales symbiont of Hymedesmia sp. n. MRB-2018]|nr:MAG: DnaA regulatory inactivator Hda [Methylococcales symbiont of Hymedesmia sp. n. MRB-2018]
MSEQLPLQFEFQSNQNFNTFYLGDNIETITHLKNRFINKEQLIYLWGKKGTGKTHLIQASSQQANKQNKSCFCFSFKPQLPTTSILDGLEQLDLICFDNIENIAGHAEWEQAFFNFFNCHRDHNKHLLLSAHCPPKFLSIQLPDLKTRMNWGLTLKLNVLTDEQQLNALIFKANDLGFKLPLNVGQFLIAHYARDLPSIWQLLDKIEHATLAEKRKITIPFLKQIMRNQ